MRRGLAFFLSLSLFSCTSGAINAFAAEDPHACCDTENKSESKSIRDCCLTDRVPSGGVVSPSTAALPLPVPAAIRSEDFRRLEPVPALARMKLSRAHAPPRGPPALPA